jgi:hypothetical protein
MQVLRPQEQGDYITYEKHKNILILHSWVSPEGRHSELEPYARDVALEIEKLQLEGIIVQESPVKRSFRKLLRKYNASWVFDLHSDTPSSYRIDDYGDLLKKAFPIARIEYGGEVWDPHAGLSMPIRNWVGELLNKFEKEKYGDAPALVLDAFWPMLRHERLLGFGLAYVRPLDVSIDLVKSLAEYLYERFQ